MGITIRTSSSSSPTAQYLDPVCLTRQDFFDIGDTERAFSFFAFGVGGA
jgi:hypothetical protein